MNTLFQRMRSALFAIIYPLSTILCLNCSAQLPTNNITPSASAIMTNGSGTMTSGSSLTVPGNLTVNGTITGSVAPSSLPSTVHTNANPGNGIAIVTNAPGQITVSTNGQLTIPAAANVTGVVTTNNGGSGVNVGLLAATNLNPMILMTPIAGGISAQQDMMTTTAPYQRAWGLSLDGLANPYIWYADTTGLGSNAWGRKPISFGNQFFNVGNSFWHDTTALINLNTFGTTFYFQNGSNSSTVEASGINTNTGAGAKQVYINAIFGNPWTGSGQIGITADETNSIFGGGSTDVNGVLLKDADGIQHYRGQFPDISLISVAQPYAKLVTNNPQGVGLLINKVVPYYVAINGTGQWPLEFFDIMPQAGGPVTTPRWCWGIPYWGANAPTQYSPLLPDGTNDNPNWQWALQVAPVTGNVTTTNGTFTFGIAFSRNTNSGALTIGNYSGGQVESGSRPWTTLFDNGGAIYNDASGQGIVVGLDYQNSFRQFAMGVEIPAVGAGAGYASGSSWTVYQSSATDLLSTKVGSQTWTAVGGFDASKNCFITNQVSIGALARLMNNTSTPSATTVGANNAVLWCSNGVLYATCSANGSTATTTLVANHP